MRHIKILILSVIYAKALPISLPTENDFLLKNQPDRFYMYCDRNFEGQASQPWEAGSYGFVRSPIRLGTDVVMTKFHEGIDIQPIHRDAAGVPQDLVNAIADGKVVHVSPQANQSNYGKYVVVEHTWENTQIYSLYAHLADITCQVGTPVRRGALLGRLGFTGAGIDKTRAHLHLEIVMLLSKRFDDWQLSTTATHAAKKPLAPADKVNPNPNPTAVPTLNIHGIFNGINLCGINAAELFLANQKNPNISFSQFVSTVPVHFKINVPMTKPPEFVKRYPWMIRNLSSVSMAKSWEISFSATGTPLAFTPSALIVNEPCVTAIRPSATPQRYLTRRLIVDQNGTPTLSKNGLKLVNLLTDNFPASAATTHPSSTLVPTSK